MKILKAEKLQPRERRKSKRTGPAVNLRRSDWDVLIQHDRISGKLDLKSTEFINDPGSVKRLLEAEMIFPDGRLTPEAREKCTVLKQKLRRPGSKPAVFEKPDEAIGASNKDDRASQNTPDKMKELDWALLMKYDRKTGNLLKADPETGELEETSREMLQNPSLIQRLINNKKILPGGWLTPEAKRECTRIEDKIKFRRSNGNGSRKQMPNPDPDGEQLSKGERESKGYAGREASNEQPTREPQEQEQKIEKRFDQDLQAFFENLVHDPSGETKIPDS